MKNSKISDLIKKYTSVLLLASLAILFMAPAVSARARAVDDPEVASAAAVLWDLDAEQYLYTKNADEQRAPASITKVMTVLLAVEAYERGEITLSDTVTVGDDVYFDISADGSSAGLKAGEELTVEQLLYCAIVSSANESCNVIAEYMAGDVASFVELMNSRALELGCTATHFTNTHGMPDDSQYSTARDLSLICAAALKHNLFKRICATASYKLPATNKSEERSFTNGNNLINQKSYYYYEYASGIKSGFTASAGYCLAAAATKEGRQLLCVVLGGESFVAEDGRTLTTNFLDARTLFDWGFDEFSYQEVLSTMRLIAEKPVKLGRGVSSVILRPEKSVTALLPNDADLSQVQLTPVIYDQGPLTAPVEQGQILGEVAVSFDGVNYGKVNLVANTKVELDRAAYIGSEIKSTLANKYVRLGITVFVVMLILYTAFIIYYNIRRRNKRRVAEQLAKRRIEEIRQAQMTSTGKSFEEIEDRHRRQFEDRGGRR